MYSLPLLPSLYLSIYLSHSNSLHLYITNPGSVSHFAKTWVSLQTNIYISKSTQHFDILLLLRPTCEVVLHAPILGLLSKFELNLHHLNPKQPSYRVCQSSITNWSQNILSEFKVNECACVTTGYGKITAISEKSVL